MVVPPPRSTERSVGRKDSVSQPPGFTSVVENLKEREKDRQTPPPRQLSETPVSEIVEQPRLLQKASTASLPASKGSSPPLTTDGSPTQTPEPPPEPEESRPGLGPMIRSKRSKGDLAGTLWRAANAAAAFKPRPGGAGERLRLAAEAAAKAEKEEKEKEGPDGITGVVPAPPRPPSRGKRDETPERPKSSGRSSVVPEVKVTVPNSSRPGSLQVALPEAQQQPKQEPAKEVTPEPEQESNKEPAKDESRPSVSTGNDAKYLQSLGIDSNILDERSQEFGKWLDYFGWVPGDQMRTRNVEEMKFDLDRELNKAQAGGWLARFREEDERVDAIKRGIDLAITECEELDNLLTLYSVELSVCSTPTVVIT